MEEGEEDADMENGQRDAGRRIYWTHEGKTTAV